MIHYVNKNIKDEELNRYILDKENNPKEVISLPYEILVHKLKFPLQMSIVQEKRISFAEAEVLLLRDLDNPSDYYVKLLTDLLAKNKNQITLFRNTPDGLKQEIFVVGSILFPGNLSRQEVVLCNNAALTSPYKPKEYQKMAKARKPSTPGEILLKEYLEPAGISPTDFAKHIGLATSTLSRLLDGKSKLTIRTAYRLAKATKTTVEFWVNLQQAIDLAEAKADKALAAEVKVIKLHPAFK
ncbi:HigA family addiction module antitoxin [Klebsiella pneumoniae]|uniref:HigA family addiction module antitoxin n=1 Tax=Klebsiella pneumoniae TaxID=573 RepID=UPI0018FE6424|nr:HigA family addiction module antitoxin [Klebsiella pneumoniae]